MVSPTPAACRAAARRYGMSDLRVFLSRYTTHRLYDRSASSAHFRLSQSQRQQIPALTTGPASHIGDDLACLVAQNLFHCLR
jgi:hypothetical protein